MNTNIYDLLKVLLICLTIAFVIFVTAGGFAEPITDYYKCIQKCPSSFKQEFTNLECPKMCDEIISCNKLPSSSNEGTNEIRLG